MAWWSTMKTEYLQRAQEQNLRKWTHKTQNSNLTRDGNEKYLRMEKYPIRESKTPVWAVIYNYKNRERERERGFEQSHGL